MESRARRDVT